MKEEKGGVQESDNEGEAEAGWGWHPIGIVSLDRSSI